MHWDSYTIFGLISGIGLVALGLLAPPTVALKTRLQSSVAGFAIGGYSIYVAHQTSGVFYFGAFIFVFPFVFPLALIGTWIAWIRQTD